MIIKPVERGSAMVELVFLMLASAVLIHQFLFLTQKFSTSNRQWVEWAQHIHQMVGHEVCLQPTAITHGHPPIMIATEPICQGL